MLATSGSQKVMQLLEQCLSDYETMISQVMAQDNERAETYQTSMNDMEEETSNLGAWCATKWRNTGAAADQLGNSHSALYLRLY